MIRYGKFFNQILIIMEIKDLILFAYPLGGKDTQTDLCINFYKNLLQEYLVISTGGIIREPLMVAILHQISSQQDL